jgi:hypothetical protein
MRLLPKVTILLNSTLKIVRGKITEKYEERINYLYTVESKDICNPKNIECNQLTYVSGANAVNYFVKYIIVG